MTTTIESPTPSFNEAQASESRKALAIPDVSAISVETLDDDSLVEFVASMESQRQKAIELFAQLCAPVNDAITAARSRIEHRIKENGGTALVHDRFNVVLEQRMDRDKRIDVLRQLESVLPSDLFKEAVYEEVKREWKADLRKLDVHARKFGGKVAEIVTLGSPRVPIGQPKLVITPRESALKSAS